MSVTALAYNVFEQRCPTRQVLERLADKWALLILCRLGAGPLRFSVLKRDIKDITQKVLTQNLRKLERDGLIAREASTDAALAVQYRLTPLGSTLTDTVAALTRWAEQNMAAVLAAQQAFDARAAASPAVRVHRVA